MDPIVISLDQLDSDIAVAPIALGVARTSYLRCPSAENARLLDRARAAVDQLLDERFAVQSTPPACAVAEPSLA